MLRKKESCPAFTLIRQVEIYPDIFRSMLTHQVSISLFCFACPFASELDTPCTEILND